MLAAGCVTSVGGGDEPDLEEIGLVLDNGLVIDNGLKLTNGIKLTNGAVLADSVNLASGIDPVNGIDLTSGAVLAGVTSPYIAPPANSGLEQWIDVDPQNQLRIIRYLVECALPATVSVRVVYRRSEVRDAGQLGLGAGWQAGLMSSAEQEKVSSCLLARVNSRAKTVSIDMFGPMPGMTSATSAELAAYSVQEGAFFGNLFLDTPQAFVCGLAVIAETEFRACDVYGCGLVKPLLTQGTHVKGYLDKGTAYVLADCFSDASCAKGSLGGGYAYVKSCSAGARTWSYPITTDIHPAGAGEECYGTYQCDDGLACSGGTCQ